MPLALGLSFLGDAAPDLVPDAAVIPYVDGQALIVAGVVARERRTSA